MWWYEDTLSMCSNEDGSSASALLEVEGDITRVR
jgi:hypothetical protein